MPESVTHAPDWVPTFTTNVENAGYVVPIGIELVNDWLSWPWKNIWRERSWEEKLQTAIEQRSIRFRLHAFRTDWSYRLRTAWAVLRDRHECAGYD